MPIRLLLIDDDVDDQLIFCEIIAEISPDIQCIGALNGLEGLQKLADMDPAPTMIFLDLNMPLISGWEVLQRIRKDERTAQIPVVIMTTSDNQADVQRARQFEATGFISKTADLPALRQTIRKTLNAGTLQV